MNRCGRLFWCRHCAVLTQSLIDKFDWVLQSSLCLVLLRWLLRADSPMFEMSISLAHIVHLAFPELLPLCNHCLYSVISTHLGWKWEFPGILFHFMVCTFLPLNSMDICWLPVIISMGETMWKKEARLKIYWFLVFHSLVYSYSILLILKEQFK